jgi:hypothetical protein
MEGIDPFSALSGPVALRKDHEVEEVEGPPIRHPPRAHARKGL